ncbi:MAG: TIGR02757 family protein [Flavobacteriales bacterium]|nr:TIGR02757 family protein [Flavobacteriales bacterium]
MQKDKVKEIVEEAYKSFARSSFIENDPIQIPHRFRQKEDIEIAGFLAATIAWGQRVTIINNASRLLKLMDDAPFDFVMNHQASDRKRFTGFVHRTFSEVDAMYFMESLQHMYRSGKGLEEAFGTAKGSTMQARIHGFKDQFFSIEHLPRTEKHVSDPMKGSSAKRLNMFLRWMVRSDQEGIDFGIWRSIESKDLMMPLDVHTSTVGRKLGLLTRKQDDWKAVEELTSSLRDFDAKDPVKYDLALFGMGVNARLGH